MLRSEYERIMVVFDEISVELYGQKYNKISETKKTKVRSTYKFRYVVEQ